MKQGIHPSTNIVNVECACGQKFQLETTKAQGDLRIEICNKCHPFYTGKQKIVDAGGRVDKFRKRYGL